MKLAGLKDWELKPIILEGHVCHEKLNFRGRRQTALPGYAGGGH